MAFHLECLRRRRRENPNPIMIRLAFLTMAMLVRSSCQASSSSSHNSEPKATNFLPDVKFGFNEYSEYLENNNNDDDDGGGEANDRGGSKPPPPPPPPQRSQLPDRDVSHVVDHPSTVATASLRSFSSSVDDINKQSLTWDKEWDEKSSKVHFGQLSAVSVDGNGDVVVFHRGDRVWGTGTFGADDVFDKSEGPVRANVVVVLSGVDGRKLSEWGKDTFYLPHGLTVDGSGNYWMTDVAMHQVFKFDAKDLPKFTADVSVSKDSTIAPSLVLGEAFVPGNDNKKFCKPTSVAVENNGDGDFFVSDGYCNQRIIKFNRRGERILSWGRKSEWEDLRMHPRIPSNAFYVPHALALAEEYGYVFVADRERGRVSCFHAKNGTFHREYQNLDSIGTRIFSVAYHGDKIYLVNGPPLGLFDPVVHVRGFVIDINDGNILSQFAPGNDLANPHDIAVSKDGRHVYVVELDPHKVYRFLNDVNSTLKQGQKQHQHRRKGESVGYEEMYSSGALPADIEESLPRRDPSDNSTVGYSIRKGVTATTIILSLVTAAVVLVALCVAVAAIVARCRKRGCLLNVRRGMPRWESERRENFKLSKLLETRKTKGKKFFDKRPNTRDFSKLNTEPETSDDENNLTKMI